MKRISVDTETLGTTTKSVPLQISAVDVDNPSSFFNAYVDWADLTKEGFRVNGSTLRFWMKQPEEIRTKVFAGTVALPEILKGLAEFCKDATEVWMNSPSFDSEKILIPAYNHFKLPVPWSFRDERDFRTLKALGFAYFDMPYQYPAGAHDALTDATAQAEYIYQMTQRMKQK